MRRTRISPFGAAAVLALASCNRSEAPAARSAPAHAAQDAPSSAVGAASRPDRAEPAREAGRDVAPIVPGVATHPLPLQHALARGLCAVVSVTSQPFNSRFVGFLLAPRTTTRPWIEVEPGWKLAARKGRGAMVTVLPARGQLLAANNSTILVPAAEIAHSSVAPMPYDWSRLADTDPLAPLLRAAGLASPPPSWNALETAVLVLTRNVDFRALRAERFSAPHDTGTVVILGAAGGRVAHDASVVDATADLLRRAGDDPQRFKLFRESEARFARALSLWRAGGRTDLQALEDLGFFVNRPEAFSILAEVWTTRPAEKKAYRQTAVRHLAGALIDRSRDSIRVNPAVRAALESARQKETDAALIREISDHLARAAKAAAR